MLSSCQKVTGQVIDPPVAREVTSKQGDKIARAIKLHMYLKVSNLLQYDHIQRIRGVGYPLVAMSDTAAPSGLVVSNALREISTCVSSRSASIAR